MQQIIHSKSMYCVQPRQQIGNSVRYSIDTTDTSIHDYENDLGAYLLSEDDIGILNYNSLVDSPVQQAIWAWLNGRDDMKNDLYYCAEQFEKYRNKYEKPTIDDKGAGASSYGNGYAYGPLKLSYVSTKWEGKDCSRSFGEIIAIEAKDANGNNVSLKLLDKDKQEMNTYPQSDRIFYLATSTKNIPMPISINICFNDVEAEGHLQYIQGYYSAATIEMSEDSSDYCDDCQAKIGNNLVDKEGYVYKIINTTTGCGASVRDTDSGNTGKKLSSHWAGYCGTELHGQPTRMCVQDGTYGGSTTGYCGSQYSLYGYYMVGSTEHSAGSISYTPNCGRSNTRTVTSYDYLAKVGCGKEIETGYVYVDPKTDQEIKIKRKCGASYTINPEYEVKSQKLIQRWGNRTEGVGKLNFETIFGQSISKIDFNSQKPLPGAIFEIYKVEEMAETDPYSTSSSTEGQSISSEGHSTEPILSWTSTTEAYRIDPPLPTGKYALREVQAPTGYKKMEKDYIFEVDEEGNIVGGNIVIDNKNIIGAPVHICKTDNDTGKAIEGATLELRRSDNSIVDTWKTEKKWREFYLPPDTYTLIETSAPSGYLLADNIKITITGYESQDTYVEIKMEDQKRADGIGIYKIVDGDTTANPVVGATLSLYAVYNVGDINRYTGETVMKHTEHLVRTWTTAKAPEHFKSKEIYPGKYKIVEEAAPYGYKIAEPQEFTVSYDLYVQGENGKKEVYFAFKNPKPNYVRVIKIDEKTRKPLEGAKFELYDSKNNLIKNWTSTKDYIKFILEDGEYTLKEVEPPEGYNLADDTTFTVAGQDIEVVVNDKKTLDEPEVTGDLSLRKFISEIDGKKTNRTPEVYMLPLAGAYGITGYGGGIEEIEGDVKKGLVSYDESKNAIEIDSITLDAQVTISDDKLGTKGWFQAESGEWYYYDDNENKVTGWQKISEIWYYFNSDGVMQTGWQKIDEKWYYFNSGGAMLTSWQKIDGYYYYFDGSGIMQTGWLLYNGNYYYLSSDGKMVTGFNKIGDYWYYFNGDGIMLTGWQKVSEYWYYFDGSGHMLTGWQKLSGVWYYFGSEGKMSIGWLKYNKNWYYFNNGQDSSKRLGAMLIGKWEIAKDEWYYFCTDTSNDDEKLGIMLKGWQTIDEHHYYFCSSGDEFDGFKEGQMLMGRHIMSDINGVDQNDKIPYIKHIYFNKIYDNYPKGVALLTSTTTADYNHQKEPAESVHIKTDVNPGSIITYTIRVYNEGPDLDMRALEIKDYKSNYLEFLPDDEINKKYKWTIDGNTLTTTALKGITIPKCNDLDTPSYADVLLRLKVKDNTPFNYTMVNVAEISKYGNANGTDISNRTLPDIDSNAGNFPDKYKSNDTYRGNGTRGKNYVQGQEDDDDFDIVVTNYVEDYMDLSLRKYITGITDQSGNNVKMTIKEGAEEISNDSRIPNINYAALPLGYDYDSGVHTATYTHPKDPIDVCEGDLVTYTITVYNEHFLLDAYAVEITDYIPEGLEFVPDHPTNAKWTQSGNKITTTALSDTKLKKYTGEGLSSASIKVVLRVKDNVAYNADLRNIAEITNYGADVYGTKVTNLKNDRDSYPNNVNTSNYNPPADNSTYQEDDDDYEVLRLTMMNIAGRLWKDGPEGKQNGTDGLIDSFETGFKDHKVTLSGGASRVVKTYDDAGHYFIGRLYINRDYKLAFEYEGQEYINTIRTGFGKDKSAGSESTEERNALNAKFYEVVKDTARNSGKQNTISLRYNVSEVTTHSQLSELKRDATFNNQTLIEARTPTFNGKDAYGTNGTGYHMNINQGAKLRTQSALALTSDVDCVDLTINGDRLNYDYKKANDKVYVTVNGQQTDKVQRDEGELVDITLKEQDFGRVYTQVVYESDYNFRIDDYKDYKGDKIDPTKTVNRELEAYVTYRLKIRNNSSKVAGTSELKIYYDSYAFKYFNKVFDNYNDRAKDMIGKDSWFVAYKSNTNGTKTVIKEGSLAWEDASQSSFNGFSAIKTSEASGLKNVLLNPNDEMYIYIRFQFLKHDEGGMQRKIVAGNRYIVGEITGYTTPEGLIDYYAQPNNIDLNNPWTNYKAEYDTTRAPGVNITPIATNPRQMSGFVFEDARTKTISADNPNMAGILTGDGTFNSSQGDKKKSNVIVQLIEQVDIGGKHYEYIWQETTTGDPNGAVKYMDKDGTLHNEHGLDLTNDIHNDKKVRNEGNFGEGGYKFTRFIPANYVVRFIYGDIVIDNKVVYSGQDYKYTTYDDNFTENTSNAKDNPVRRNIAMNFSNSSNNNNTIDYRMSRILQNIGVETELLRKNTWINADTKNMEVRIADSGLGHGVNFGIVERPKSQLSINKEIVGVKISNKGIIIIDTENGRGKPIVAPYKDTFQELDDELINGATLEVKYRITVSNEGELDTLYNYYEGNTTYGANQGKHITTAATLVYDYPERIGFDAGTNPTWTANDVNLDIVWDQVKNNIQDRVQKGTGLVIKSENQALNKELIPKNSNQAGDKTASSEIVLKRVLSRGQTDGFTFNNMTEIIRTKNAVGRKDAVNTYGDYIPFSNDINHPNDPTSGKNETDASYAQVIVTSNAGLPYNPHYEIWITAGAILVVGIILIKIFVIPKKKKDKES